LEKEEAKQLREEAETELRDFCVNNFEERKPRSRAAQSPVSW
jgi:hypothetical protein